MAKKVTDKEPLEHQKLATYHHELESDGIKLREIREISRKQNFETGQMVTLIVYTRIIERKIYQRRERVENNVLVDFNEMLNFNENDIIVFEELWTQLWVPNITKHQAFCDLIPWINGGKDKILDKSKKTKKDKSKKTKKDKSKKTKKDKSKKTKKDKSMKTKDKSGMTIDKSIKTKDESKDKSEKTIDKSMKTIDKPENTKDKSEKAKDKSEKTKDKSEKTKDKSKKTKDETNLKTSSGSDESIYLPENLGTEDVNFTSKGDSDSISDISDSFSDSDDSDEEDTGDIKIGDSPNSSEGYTSDFESDSMNTTRDTNVGKNTGIGNTSTTSGDSKISKTSSSDSNEGTTKIKKTNGDSSEESSSSVDSYDFDDTEATEGSQNVSKKSPKKKVLR